MAFEAKIIEVIEGKRSAPITRGILTVLSQFFRLGTKIHRFAYTHVIPKKCLSLPVISIGNIVAGGTGKTPFVRYLAERLTPFAKIAILSRGYKRKDPSLRIVTPTSTPEECGDEPLWLSQKLPQATVVVGKDRTFSSALAEQSGAEVLLLDDGMQYHKLERSCDIVVMHASDLFGGNSFLPRGYLREDPRELRNADLIIVNGIESPAHFAAIQNELRAFTDAPLAAMDLKVLNDIKGKRLAAFCAIAAPERFSTTLEKAGAAIVCKMQKPDHTPFTSQEITAFAAEAQLLGAELLVCTEKDLVKLPLCNPSLPLIALETVLEPSWGKEHLEQLINQIIEATHERKI